jgi:hypothetical protein
MGVSTDESLVWLKVLTNEKREGLAAKRIEYKEATLRFGRRRLLNFEVFKGLHRKERGGGGVLDSV